MANEPSYPLLRYLPPEGPPPADADRFVESFVGASHSDPADFLPPAETVAALQSAYRDASARAEAARLRESANTWNAFLQARYTDAAFEMPLTGEAAVNLARANRMLGYAHGCIDTMLAEGRTDLAMAKLGWMVNEGRQWARHPEHPDNRPAAR
jgi:hypothetical protein